MTNKELIKIAYELGAHPYSVGAMVAALQKGIEIGKQETIDKACDAYCKLHCYDETRWMCRNNPISRCTTFEVIKKAMEE